jgi:rsbT co-antagonist protein RsbR
VALVQTVEASRLMGASVIITGLSSEVGLTIGVDLSKMNAVGDLQGGGIDEAERLLGYQVTRSTTVEPVVDIG